MRSVENRDLQTSELTSKVLCARGARWVEEYMGVERKDEQQVIALKDLVKAKAALGNGPPTS